MTEFISHSQAGQDKFVYDTLGKSGTFLDIGCGFPIEINNTYALEQIGLAWFACGYQSRFRRAMPQRAYKPRS